MLNLETTWDGSDTKRIYIREGFFLKELVRDTGFTFSQGKVVDSLPGCLQWEAVSVPCILITSLCRAHGALAGRSD